MRTCAIHQPNFFPWLGYFDKIYKSDVFVFLNAVDYPKSSKTMSTWSNRVQIAVNGRAHWINCPVIREEGKQKICNVRIDNRVLVWREKLIKVITHNYKKSYFYDEVSDFIYSLINFQSDKLSEYNYNNIKEICKMLHIDTYFYKQTDLDTSDASTKLLIEITKKVNCDSYLCGGGAGGYQEDDLFEKNGISLIYQNYEYP